MEVTRTMDIVQKARTFAIEAHTTTKYGDLPYEFHLKAVVEALPKGASPETVAAAWLHDTVEDTKVTLFEIREKFGGRVARLVDSVTDEPGKNRKERKAKTYPKIMAAPPEARAIKLADRYANMKSSIENPKLADMYRGEFPEFIRKVGFDEENSELVLKLFWLYLDSLEAARESNR